MKTFKIIVWTLIVASCAPIQVSYDYERSVDFSRYTTYNYYQDLETGLSELDTKRLINAMDANLQARGLKLSEVPDFFINIQSQEYHEAQRSSVGVGVGGSGRNVGGGVSIGIPIEQSNINRQIIIDFIDENKTGLIWQAVSESSFNPNASPSTREKKLRAIVEKVLSQYPPSLK
jgi:hypothetical protein